jgi:hypothetical protein
MNHTRYVGLEVHKASISIAVLDADDKLLREAIIKTGASTITDFFKGLTGSVHLTFAEGHHAQCIAKELKARRLRNTEGGWLSEKKML